ncbi:MAG: hypothetical protein AAB853_00600 [Patescibacteria group bacterium]
MILPFLHTNERVLYRSRRSIAALLRGMLRGVLHGMIAGIVCAAVSAVGITLAGMEVSLLVLGIIVVLCVLLLALWHWRLWKETLLTITSQRIIVDGYDLFIGEGREAHRVRSLLRPAQQTVQWQTLQESVFDGGPLSGIMNTGSLTIRHGTAEASRKVTLTSLPFALDLKHYLDKIQSLKAAKVADAELPAFVRARRGKRDQAVLTEV